MGSLCFHRREDSSFVQNQRHFEFLSWVVCCSSFEHAAIEFMFRVRGHISLLSNFCCLLRLGYYASGFS